MIFSEYVNPQSVGHDGLTTEQRWRRYRERPAPTWRAALGLAEYPEAPEKADQTPAGAAASS
jgi:hypothetical protein